MKHATTRCQGPERVHSNSRRANKRNILPSTIKPPVLPRIPKSIINTYVHRLCIEGRALGRILSQSSPRYDNEDKHMIMPEMDLLMAVVTKALEDYPRKLANMSYHKRWHEGDGVSAERFIYGEGMRVYCAVLAIDHDTAMRYLGQWVSTWGNLSMRGVYDAAS